MSACDMKLKHWQNTAPIYCQCDEHDAGDPAMPGWLYKPKMRLSSRVQAVALLGAAYVCVAVLALYVLCCMGACAVCVSSLLRLMLLMPVLHCWVSKA
jgi:hypothetical protein